GERGHADEEDPAPSVAVAEPPAGDKTQGEREAVAADDQLKSRGTAAELRVQHGGGDVDGEEVEHVHKHAGQHGGEDQPRGQASPRVRRLGDGGGDRLGLGHAAALKTRPGAAEGTNTAGSAPGESGTARVPGHEAATTW